MMYRMCRMILLAACLGVAGGCGITGPYLVCTEEARPGIHLRIRAAQGGVLVPEDVRVTLREGEYVEEPAVYRVPGADHLDASGAYERAGTYEVTVRAPGYRIWTASRVRVTADECHVRTERLDVLLQPET